MKYIFKEQKKRKLMLNLMKPESDLYITKEIDSNLYPIHSTNMNLEEEDEHGNINWKSGVNT